jgi:hypothetical protein
MALLKLLFQGPIRIESGPSRFPVLDSQHYCKVSPFLLTTAIFHHLLLYVN